MKIRAVVWDDINDAIWGDDINYAACKCMIRYKLLPFGMRKTGTRSACSVDQLILQITEQNRCYSTLIYYNSKSITYTI